MSIQAENRLIEKYLPLMDIWAMEFVKRKKGKTVAVENLDDYIQSAYVGLTKFVRKHKCINEDNFKLLILAVKHELYDHAYESLGIRVPYSQFKKMYLSIESMETSLEGLLEQTEGVMNRDGTLYDIGNWCTHSAITLDERLDMALAVESMTEKQQEIFQLLMEGESYSDIAKITGKAFSTIYEQVESIRRILKKKAWLSFLSKE